jgi:hypothetical protein
LRPIYFDAVLDGGVAERKYLWTIEYLSLSLSLFFFNLPIFLWLSLQKQIRPRSVLFFFSRWGEMKGGVVVIFHDIWNFFSFRFFRKVCNLGFFVFSFIAVKT